MIIDEVKPHVETAPDSGIGAHGNAGKRDAEADPEGPRKRQKDC